eukprot:3212514-Rhodomonas_salina.1
MARVGRCHRIAPGPALSVPGSTQHAMHAYAESRQYQAHRHDAPAASPRVFFLRHLLLLLLPLQARQGQE